MRWTWAVMAAGAVFSLSGCGTFCNFGASIVHFDGDELERPAIYGGFQLDMETARGLANTGGFGANENKATAVLVLLELADIPLTLVTDTLTLPITVLVQEVRRAGRHQDAPATENVESSAMPPSQPAQVENAQ